MKYKFRAWSEELKKFLPENEWSLDHENGEAFGYYSADIHSHKLILSQFTGLLDKNGKEIYEGDIMHGNTSKLGSVTFENGSFIWLGEPLAWDMAEPEICLPERWAQVIGNIFEHPDLLTQ